MITTAYAQTAGATMGGGSMLAGWLPVLLVFFVFYWLVLRPQQRRAKEHHEMIHTLDRGDKIITAGGLYATVTKILDEDKIEIELAENVRIFVQRQSITALTSKASVKEEKKTEKKPKKAKK